MRFGIVLRLMTHAWVQAWSSLLSLFSVGGVQMMMPRMLGGYLWRTLEAARQHPIYSLEDNSDQEPRTHPQSQKVEQRLGA